MEQTPAGVDPGPGWQWRFWSIFAGQSLSLIGSAMTQFVLIWWITDTTGDLGALATAGLAALLPQALLGPVGGTFADRYSRRMLMIVADLLSAFCIVVLITLFLSGHIALWHIYLAMFVRSAATAFQMPAASASEAMLVPRHFLPRAAGLNQTLMGIVTVAAAPLGAIAIALMPPGMFLLAAIFWALSGLFFILGDAPFTALIETTVPNRLQGRVLGLLGTMMGLAAPFGLLVSAPLGGLIGVRWMFVLTGGLGTLVSLSAFLSSELRDAD